VPWHARRAAAARAIVPIDRDDRDPAPVNEPIDQLALVGAQGVDQRLRVGARGHHHVVSSRGCRFQLVYRPLMVCVSRIDQPDDDAGVER